MNMVNIISIIRASIYPSSKFLLEYFNGYTDSNEALMVCKPNWLVTIASEAGTFP
jgi:hypothetical protein